MNYETWRHEMSEWARSRGHDVVLFDTVGSTNRVGRAALSRTDAGASSWIFALHQSAGSGRLGRAWSSPHGAGVYASRVVSLPRAVIPTAPLLVGVALCEGLAELGFHCRLKWPNDLLFEGRKIGGILLRARASGATAGVVAGIGVNFGHRREDLPRADSTSLLLEGALPGLSLVGLSTVLADSVDRELAGARRGGETMLSRTVERYARHSTHRLGDRLSITSAEGRREGEFAGFSEGGQLRLRAGSGEVLISAGEVES